MAGNAYVYEAISLEDSLNVLEKDFTHAAHVMLYAKWPGALLGKYPYKYGIMVSEPPCCLACSIPSPFCRCRLDLMGHWDFQGVWWMVGNPQRWLPPENLRKKLEVGSKYNEATIFVLLIPRRPSFAFTSMPRNCQWNGLKKLREGAHRRMTGARR
jgi:hypothetical protein